MNIPFFRLCERTGKYQARRALTDEQIIKAAKKLLDCRVCRGAKLDNPQIVKDYLATYFSRHKAEAFVCLFADNQHRLLKVESMFSGSINSASVHPREVVRRCLELNAAAVIFAHNHPGGTAKPSISDITTTMHLKESLAMFDVRALDHFIVGGADTYSFAERGLM